MAAVASPILVREIQQQIDNLGVRGVEEYTLLELVEAVGEVAQDDVEIVATVVHMLRAGSVRLTGNFHDEPISEFDAAAQD